MGTLYLVPTPIGNLDDMTFRAVTVLKSVNLIAAEDTRTSSVLLHKYNITTPLTSYHKYNETKRTVNLIGRLELGDDIALITDAGSPGISDPAQILVETCIAHNIAVTALPGATALIPAITASGVSTEQFSFWGFLPKTKGKLITQLEFLSEHKETMVFYESPQRVVKTLNDMKNIFGDRHVVLAKEITKIHETYFRGTISRVLSELNESNLRGEFVIIVQGTKEKIVSDDMLIRLLNFHINNGLSKKDAVKKIAEKYKQNKNKIYELSLRITR